MEAESQQPLECKTLRYLQHSRTEVSATKGDREILRDYPNNS
jgi:hypothetical protein